MKTLGFVFSYARKYVRYLVISVLCMIGLVGVQLLGPQVVRALVALVGERSWDVGTQAQLTRLALGLLAIYLVRAALRFGSGYMAHVAGWGVVADSRRSIYAHLQRLSMRFYEDQQTGQLMSRMINDSDMFERLIAHAIPDTFVNVLMLIGVSAVLVSMN